MAKDQAIEVDQRGELQPADKGSAQTAHKTDKGKMPSQQVEQDDQPNKDSIPG
jgi:hypothetical protein